MNTDGHRLKKEELKSVKSVKSVAKIGYYEAIIDISWMRSSFISAGGLVSLRPFAPKKNSQCPSY